MDFRRGTREVAVFGDSAKYPKKSSIHSPDMSSVACRCTSRLTDLLSFA